MIGASFNKIGTEGMALQDLAPTGYENVEYFTEEMGGVMGEFQIRILNKNGGQALDKDGKDANYFFNRTYLGEGEWDNDGLWTYLDGNTPDNIVFELGEGLWVNVSADAYTAGNEKYYLVFPGIDDLAK